MDAPEIEQRKIKFHLNVFIHGVNLFHHIGGNFLLFVKDFCYEFFAENIVVLDMRLGKLRTYYHGLTLGLTIFSFSAHDGLQTEIIDLNVGVLNLLEGLFALVLIVEGCPGEPLEVVIYYRSAHGQVNESGNIFLLKSIDDVRPFNLNGYVSQK